MSSTRRKVKTANPLQHAVSGLTAACTTSLFLHPVDVVKVRMQVSTKSVYSSTWSTLSHLFKEEGPRSLWRGLSSNLLGSGVAWGGYFWVYNGMKDYMRQRSGGDKLGAMHHLTASTLSGLVIVSLVNPIFVVKTRMLADPRYAGGTVRGAAEHVMYRNVFHGLVDLARTEGLPGLYRGYTTGVIGISHGAVHFVVYEYLKDLVTTRKKRSEATHKSASTTSTEENTGGGEDSARGKPSGDDWKSAFSTPELLLMSSSSKIAANGITYPYQVVRARMQLFSQSQGGDSARSSSAESTAHARPRGSYVVGRSLLDCVSRTWRHEGFMGFYRGVVVSTIKVLPQTCMIFFIYERMHETMAHQGWGGDAE